MNIYNISGVDLFFDKITKEQANYLEQYLKFRWDDIFDNELSGVFTTQHTRNYFTFTCMFNKAIVTNMEKQLARLEFNRHWLENVCAVINEDTGSTYIYDGSEFYIGLNALSSTSSINEAIVEDMNMLTRQY